MFEVLIISFAVAVGLNILMFFPAYFLKTDKLTDISYALTFALLAWYFLLTGTATAPAIILTCMVTAWAARLGAYLLVRIHKMGRDDRFDKMRPNFVKFLGFWLLQGFTVWMVTIPAVLYLGNPQPVSFAVATIGILIWVTGLLVETNADLQLFRFINNPANKGKWIDKGLWHYSRHPNYFGEIFLWFGAYVFVVTGLSASTALLGLVGPAYIAGLIIFVSGIPILEKKADARWGSDSEYQKYKAGTSILIPWFSKNK